MFHTCSPKPFFSTVNPVNLMCHTTGRGRNTLYTKGSEESLCQLAILELERRFYGGLIEAYNSSSNEPVIAAKSLVQQDAGRKPYECGTIRDNRANYGHDPDLFVL